MTREEAIEVLKLVDENASCDDCLYYAQMEDCPTDEDCIIRQALDMAIHALSQEPCEDWYDVPSDKMTLEQARQAVKDLRNKLAECLEQDPSRKWIPVSERLPEDNYAVLVWCPERKNSYCAYRAENQWWIFGAYFQKIPLEVIAWIPLPKPYEPQESEKINCKSTKCENCTNHNYCDYEPQESEDKE